MQCNGRSKTGKSTKNVGQKTLCKTLKIEQTKFH